MNAVVDKPDQSDQGPELPRVLTVETRAPLDWLAAGWQDLKATAFRGLAYGAVFAAMGWLVTFVYETRWQLTMGLIGGFFLLGPFIATGLYELSRQRERAEPAALLNSAVCWLRNPGAIGLFAVVLTFVMIVWARISVIEFALTSTTVFATLQNVVGQIVAFDNLPFLALWFATGAVFATIVFAISVVAVPMMLDRGSDTFGAVFTSARVLAANPKPMALWALLIVAVIGVSLLAGFLPLLITGPLVGHATWHAYRATVAR